MALGVSRPESSSMASSQSSDCVSPPPPSSYFKPTTDRDHHPMPSTAARTGRTASSSRTTRSTAKPSVVPSDRQLADLAADTEARINWAEILTRSPDVVASDRTEWNRIDDVGSFAIYSKQEPHKFAVLAVGVLPCSVPEVSRLLHSPTAETYLVNMEGLYGEEFKDGAFVHRANLRRLDQHENQVNQELVDLTVKSAMFDKAGWRQQYEKWSFLEATYRRDGGACFEKLTTTLAPQDVAFAKNTSTFPAFSRSTSDGTGSSSSRSKNVHDLTTAFCVQAEEQEEPLRAGGGSNRARPWSETRVYFYGEFAPPARSGFSIPTLTRSLSVPSDKSIKQRLVTMARSCDRLTRFVRRRRLGVQVLVDRRVLSLLFSSPAKRCGCCNKSIVLLGVKQCRICGHGVCTECSHKHERETQVRGSTRMLLEDVRVCDHCLDRVDRSDFSELTDASLLGPTVFPNALHAPLASNVLKVLLQHELRHAESPSRKVSVLNVIKCVLDQESQMTIPHRLPPLSPTASLTSTDRSVAMLLASTQHEPLHEADYVNALETLMVPQVPFYDAELATTNGRAYAVDASSPDQQMAFPLPANEAERLRAMDHLHIKELINNSDELNIICELAAKEMDTFASMVTIVTPDEQQVVASNLEALQTATFPRADAFCSHTIMDDRPLLLPHPEADVRFHQCAPVKDLGIRYYCGFPIKNEHDTVIGALCCINKATLEMSETQFNAMQKLAQTAGKVIHAQGKQQARLRSMSMASNNASN